MHLPKPNSYSAQWFEFFQNTIAESRTTQETEFIRGCVPLPEFRKIADLCCGNGRHARALAAGGYQVTGIERDHDTVARARELGGGPVYLEVDVRAWQVQPASFDAVILMSQSFGWFEAETNRQILQTIAQGVRRGGRVILDLWNPEFFASRDGQRLLETARGSVIERKQIAAGRLLVTLKYPGGAKERFEWQLFAPAEMKKLAEEAGLSMVKACTDFQLSRAPSRDNPRIQFLLARGAT